MTSCASWKSFSEDGNECRGRWTYPAGGGYESNMTRMEAK